LPFAGAWTARVWRDADANSASVIKHQCAAIAEGASVIVKIVDVGPELGKSRRLVSARASPPTNCALRNADCGIRNPKSAFRNSPQRLGCQKASPAYSLRPRRADSGRTRASCCNNLATFLNKSFMMPWSCVFEAETAGLERGPHHDNPPLPNHAPHLAARIRTRKACSKTSRRPKLCCGPIVSRAHTEVRPGRSVLRASKPSPAAPGGARVIVALPELRGEAVARRCARRASLSRLMRAPHSYRWVPHDRFMGDTVQSWARTRCCCPPGSGCRGCSRGDPRRRGFLRTAPPSAPETAGKSPSERR
jgi:hypothetical protein